MQRSWLSSDLGFQRLESRFHGREFLQDFLPELDQPLEYKNQRISQELKKTGKNRLQRQVSKKSNNRIAIPIMTWKSRCANPVKKSRSVSVFMQFFCNSHLQLLLQRSEAYADDFLLEEPCCQWPWQNFTFWAGCRGTGSEPKWSPFEAGPRTKLAPLSWDFRKNASSDAETVSRHRENKNIRVTLNKIVEVYPKDDIKVIILAKSVSWSGPSDLSDLTCLHHVWSCVHKLGLKHLNGL